MKTTITKTGYLKQIIQYALYHSKWMTDRSNATPYGTCNTLITAIENRENYGKDAIIVKQTCQVQQDGVFIVVKEEIEKV